MRVIDPPVSTPVPAPVSPLAIAAGDNKVRWRAGERFHHLFERQLDRMMAAGRGGHLAVCTSERDWSYSDLDHYANRLARYLLSIGIASGARIGLLFDRSVHSYAAILAVSKIHAVFVPMDAAFPPERISYIVEDAGLAHILTQSTFQPLLDQTGVSSTSLDRLGDRLDGCDNARLSQEETGSPVTELCYIIYTSGSTGQPKGTLIEQRNICNFLQVAAETYGYRESDKVYQGLTIAFDFSVEEIWAPLLSGATLMPNQTGASLIGDELADFLRTQRVTALCCVPTLLATIEAELPDLRLLIVSGEACPQHLVDRWAGGQRTMLNVYGPTETTVTATLARLKPGEAVTIGQPLPTYSVMILEPGTTRLLPKGEEGEIAIAGIGVAPGYLNRPEQTRRAFIPDFLNLHNNPSGLIYRSGDLGRIRGDGNIEYHGRIDKQVKISGYRIELDEITARMLDFPGVAQAVVTVVELQPGARELAAYYVLRDDARDWDETALRKMLRDSLPAYMTPAWYERLESMPMMASDKVDTKALPKPSGRRDGGKQSEIVPPASRLEKTLEVELARLLKLESVSVTDDFFEHLGAGSLLMARYCAAIRQAVPEVDISMRDVYARSTIRALATHLEKTQGHSPASAEASPKEAPEIPSVTEYLLCGSLQLASYLAFFILVLSLSLRAASWLLDASGAIDAYMRIVTVTVITFVGWSAFVVAAKWLIVGRWKIQQIPLWSLRYFRFWLVRKLVASCPLNHFKGSPLFNVYLRWMGARIGRNVVFECRDAPVCTDLLRIGDNTILRHDSLLVTHKARNNRLHTGTVELGDHVVIGEGSVIDLNTRMGNRAQLGHASCLIEGQAVPAGEHWHGNPAEPASVDYSAMQDLPPRPIHQALYALGPPLFWLLIGAPVLLLLLGAVARLLIPETPAEFSMAWVREVFEITIAAYMGGLTLVLLRHTLWTRLLNRFLQTGRRYPRYGLHFLLFNAVRRAGNAPGFNLLFGDSSAIVGFMKLLGYRFNGVLQTGSNFGLEHRHDNPLLCRFGRGTMISDGFVMQNVIETANAFKLEETVVGNDNFVGNNVYYPCQGQTGDNCLLATKVMVPIEGPRRENVGLLGSPSFEIPRYSRGDEAAISAVQQARAEGLPAKNRHNFTALLAYMSSGFVYLFITLLVFWSAIGDFRASSLFGWFVTLTGFSVFTVAYVIVLERAAYTFRRMQPVTVSIYDPQYWRVERLWKFSETFLRKLWLGTPFRAIINRLLGIRQGKMVFDDGLYVSEKTLVRIGDYCNFNSDCVLQSHSLENGIYKSDHIVLGNHCSLEARAFVHYGAELGDGVTVLADAFVMKGEHPASHSTWGGNPARALNPARLRGGG